MSCVVPPYAGPLVGGAANVPVEVTVNGQQFSKSSVTFRYYDPSAWRLLKFTPRGGPLTGNTSMTLDSDKLESLGDVRCRFGQQPTEEMNATIISPSLLRCVSPPHWERRQRNQHVEIQLTLNGQDYLRIGQLGARQFTYYALDTRKGLSVRRLNPNGGPAGGGTLVRLSGTGFGDLTGRPDDLVENLDGRARLGRGEGERRGTSCQFAGEPAIEATLLDSETLLCYSPPTDVSSRFEGRHVEVSINGQLDQQTSSGINFHYYRTGEDVRVSSIYPMGGPRAGGTTVTVRGTGFRDLDHGNGLYCSFGTDGPLVPATVAPGSAEDPTSYGQLTCLSPPITPTSAESQASCVARMTVPVLSRTTEQP